MTVGITAASSKFGDGVQEHSHSTHFRIQAIFIVGSAQDQNTKALRKQVACTTAKTASEQKQQNILADLE